MSSDKINGRELSLCADIIKKIYRYWHFIRIGDAVQRWLRHPEPSSWSRKSTIKEKLPYVSSLSEFFSLVRKERKGQKEESIPLLISFCRLAATGANTLPPTVRQLLNHGYRFETLKRRLGFTAVPCRAMANLAVQIWVRVCVRT